jgi:hypothetical protein
MPDTLFLCIIRHLNDLYWENGLTPEQIRALAEFTIELCNETKQHPSQNGRSDDARNGTFDETAHILRELFPETAYSLV